MIILLSAWSGAHAQVVPEATGPGRLPVSGNLQYALRYSQTAEFGSLVGDWQTATPSASLDYSTGNERHPFSVSYAGGYVFDLAGPAYGVGFFQHLSVSQGLTGRRWSLQGSDDRELHMPQTPTTGFAGVPGTGGPIGGAGSSSQSILTVNTHSVTNMAMGEYANHLDFASTLNIGGYSELLRFPDGNGLDLDGLQAHAGLTRRLDARNSISGQYVFARYSYPASTFTSSFTGGARQFQSRFQFCVCQCCIPTHMEPRVQNKCLCRTGVSLQFQRGARSSPHFYFGERGVSITCSVPTPPVSTTATGRMADLDIFSEQRLTSSTEPILGNSGETLPLKPAAHSGALPDYKAVVESRMRGSAERR